jgi:hypothetical protein
MFEVPIFIQYPELTAAREHGKHDVSSHTPYNYEMGKAPEFFYAVKCNAINAIRRSLRVQSLAFQFQFFLFTFDV